MSALRCRDASLAACEPLAATATHAERWLVVEAPGAWPREVGDGSSLPDGAREAVAAWLERTPRSRLLLVRRPGSVAQTVAVHVVLAPEARADGEVRRLELASLERLADADLDAGGERVERALVLVCGHGSRDACCARLGTPVFGALGGVPGAEAWLSSHHGGHRFAANALVLPAAVHLGRLEPAVACAAVETVLAGRLDLARYRGRTCYPPEVQAAERAVREHTGLLHLDDLALAGSEDGVVRFRTRDGDELAAAVERVPGPLVPASCGAEPEPQPLLRARAI